MKFSIASVYELFAISAKPAFKVLGLDPPAHLALDIGHGLFEEDRETRMLRAGWCPYDVAAAKERFTSVQTLYFISRMKKADTTRDHKGCQEDFCKWNQIEKNQYKALHCQKDCNCEDVGVEAPDLEEHLTKGRLPLLSIKDFDQGIKGVRIEVSGFVGKERYVAISHVWVYGLGNPFANSLPRCQVAQLGGLVSNLKNALGMEKVLKETAEQTDKNHPPNGEKPDSENGEMYLWIDTLCCPVSPPSLKTMAIVMLEQTYRNATCVLVLDGGIMTYDSTKIPAYECVTQVFTSSWLQRLWTLQEGVLAEMRLWFQFAERPRRLQELMDLMWQQSMARIVYLPFQQEMMEQWRVMLTMWSKTQENSKKLPTNSRVGQDLAMLSEGLRYRSVTVESDEALCIATLLQLPVTEIANRPAEVNARMSLVWELIAKSTAVYHKGYSA